MCGCSVTERYLYSVRLDQPSDRENAVPSLYSNFDSIDGNFTWIQPKNAPEEDINGQHPNNEIIQKTTCIERPIFYLMIYVPMLH